METEDLEWIFIESNQEIPNGLWVVRDEYDSLQVADFRKKVGKTIGHYFEFDTKVVAYAPLMIPKS
jgi:hypothetical protein